MDFLSMGGCAMLKKRFQKIIFWIGALCLCACCCFFVSSAAEGAASLPPASANDAPLPSLPQLETRLGDSPEVLAALAALARDGHTL